MTMAGKVFVDTNILIRAFHDTFPEHPRIRELFDKFIDDGYELWISRQIIREYLVQATSPRTFSELMSIASVEGLLNNITKICRVADETEAITSQLVELLNTHPTRGKQVHDANIVATMLVNEIDVLLTLNIVDLKRFEDVIRVISV